MKKVIALLVVLVLLAVIAFAATGAPATITCGSVSGGQTMTVAGINKAQSFGEKIRDIALHPEKYRDSLRIKGGVDGIQHTLYLWVRTLYLSLKGSKIDPQILQLQQQQEAQQQSAQAACSSPCPTGQGGQQPWDPKNDTLTIPAMPGRATAEAAASRYWSGDDLRVAVAIAGAESSYRPDASLTFHGEHMRGLWQINDGAHAALVASGNWQDPADNARMAHQVWLDAGKSWTPWSTYNSGSYKRFLGSVGSVHAAVALPDPSPPATPQAGTQGQCSGNPDATITTWNSLGCYAGKHCNSDANVIRGFRAIAQTATVISGQELPSEARRAKVRAALPGWQMTNDGTAVPIMWNTSRYDLLAQGKTEAMTASEGGPKWIVWAELRDKTSGVRFAVVNTHIKVHPTEAQYARQVNRLTGLTDKLQAAGDSVIVTGDWNASGDPHLLMGVHGLTSNFETLGMLPTHGDRAIDNVWSVGAVPSSQRVLPAFGSDHHPVEVVFVHSDSPGADSTPASGVRTVKDVTSGTVYQVPIPAGPRGVALNFALDQEEQGDWYKFGAQGPDRWDCSGLVSKAWESAGFHVYPQTEVIVRQEAHVAKAEPGDLFYHPGHVQMFVGIINGRTIIVEAPHTGSRLRIRPQWMRPTATLDPTRRKDEQA